MRSPLLQIHFFLAILLTLSAAGCESIHYYGQAIRGQAAIIANRRPIERLLAEPDTPEKLKVKLRQVLSLREFAENELSLPVDDHYLTYVALDRPYVVWTVFAAPEFSFSPKTWRFPIVGRTVYRGYFSKNTAHRYAEKLKRKGWDVFIGPVTAFSTLGWFNDPVLSTVIYRSDAGLARIIFHELAHQILYVDDDTVFNESFATAVEQEGIHRWAVATNNTRAYEEYLLSRRRSSGFTALVMTYRDHLNSIYQKDMPVAEKKRQKAETINALREKYRDLRQQWQGYSGYDQWFQEPINNAKINAVSTYHEWVPLFRNLIQSLEGDLDRFYQTCRQLSKKPRGMRLKELENEIQSHRLSSTLSGAD